MLSPMLQLDVRDLIKTRGTFESIAANTPQAISRALNWTGDKARTQAGRALAKQTGLAYGRVRQELKTHRASPRDMLYAIGVAGNAIPLKEFKARQTRLGVSAAPWGNRRVFAHTFIVGMLGENVFVRTSKDRLPIRKLFGPSLPRELVRDAVPKAWKETAETEFADRVLHEMERLFPGQE